MPRKFFFPKAFTPFFTPTPTIALTERRGGNADVPDAAMRRRSGAANQIQNGAPHPPRSRKSEKKKKKKKRLGFPSWIGLVQFIHMRGSVLAASPHWLKQNGRLLTPVRLLHW